MYINSNVKLLNTSFMGFKFIVHKFSCVDYRFYFVPRYNLHVYMYGYAVVNVGKTIVANCESEQ